MAQSKNKFVALGYTGIDTRKIGRARTRKGAERLIERCKHDQVRRQGIVYWSMFWVEEETF